MHGPLQDIVAIVARQSRSVRERDLGDILARLGTKAGMTMAEGEATEEAGAKGDHSGSTPTAT